MSFDRFKIVEVVQRVAGTI